MSPEKSFKPLFMVVVSNIFRQRLKNLRGEGIKSNKNYELQLAFFMDGAFELLEFNHKPIIWKCNLIDVHGQAFFM